jgi:hypothetical protein
MVHGFVGAFGFGFTAELALSVFAKGRKGIETAQPVSMATTAAAAANLVMFRLRGA